MLVNGHRPAVPFDFLLTDFNLPRLSGLDLIDALREEGLELPSLLMSGDFDETLESQAMARGCVGFLQKPFQLSALIGHLRETLEDDAESVEMTG
jgi:FixJ family two-component response regulator